ncbi:DUF4397 domain-containing protein [Heliophilum fasciatum]|uniref:Uncharacterized protein DUF4397 n=1 Tax=Heliophilum fasciatum TaxID=35700 RepID=A0A4R2RYA7_9FIRM|nr:DUF4397 domain-containing protein [Heliophilum fasciatum]MCW2277633.1 hypothetical protein [Heliophilum fasciatum]TCP64981.1 uncharacterized protein DUF4397 [Heliophilum fasciatum]
MMHDDPEDLSGYQAYNVLTPNVAYLRFLHASPNAPAVDVFLNERLVARNFTYADFTHYLPALPGRYRVRLFPAGRRRDPLIDRVLTLAPQSIATAAVIGMPQALSLQIQPEPKLPFLPGRLYLRFAHLSPNAPAVDLTLADGTVLFRNVTYPATTDYRVLLPGTYTLQLRLAGTDQVVLRVPNARLRPGRFYTVDAVGLVGERPPLQVLIPLDGNTYLR